jgi:hypothetical protein
MRAFINAKNIAAIDELKIDVNKDKPAMQVLVDRKRQANLGLLLDKLDNNCETLYLEQRQAFTKRMVTILISTCVSTRI